LGALYAGLAALGLLGLNAPLYRFFWRKRGGLFALGTVPWHWLYYLYGSAGFAYVLLTERRRGKPAARPRLMDGDTSPSP
jgi:hypothetical protein